MPVAWQIVTLFESSEADGEAEADSEADGLALADSEAEALAEAEADSLADGEALAGTLQPLLKMAMPAASQFWE